jgi:hypothetical protein
MLIKRVRIFWPEGSQKRRNTVSQKSAQKERASGVFVSEALIRVYE